MVSTSSPYANRMRRSPGFDPLPLSHALDLHVICSDMSVKFDNTLGVLLITTCINSAYVPCWLLCFKFMMLTEVPAYTVCYACSAITSSRTLRVTTHGGSNSRYVQRLEASTGHGSDDFGPFRYGLYGTSTSDSLLHIEDSIFIMNNRASSTAHVALVIQNQYLCVLLQSLVAKSSRYRAASL